MKRKLSIDKKILLNKSTISKLSDRQKELLKGGAQLFETRDGGYCISYAQTCNG